jgi:hypothetical protein
MTDGIRSGFARLFADDSGAPADASDATKTAGSDLRSPWVHLDAPPIANADGEPHYDPHEDDVDGPTIAGIRRAETSARSDKRRAPKSPASDDDAAPSAKGVFFRNFPVSIEPLPSQNCGAALSSTNKRTLWARHAVVILAPVVVEMVVVVAVAAPAAVETIPLMPVVTLMTTKRSLWMTPGIPLIVVPSATIVTILTTSVLNMLGASHPWSPTGRRSN